MQMQSSQAVRDDLFRGYQTGAFFDEMFAAEGELRPHYAPLHEELASMLPAEFEERRRLADSAFLLQGITFTVYSDGQGTERLFPFDLVPRILPRSEWERHRARSLPARDGAESLPAGRLRHRSAS